MSESASTAGAARPSPESRRRRAVLWGALAQIKVNLLRETKAVEYAK